LKPLIFFAKKGVKTVYSSKKLFGLCDNRVKKKINVKAIYFTDEKHYLGFSI